MESEKGQSLIEVIIAATVGIMVVSALTFATIFSLRNANFAKTSSQATKLAQEGIERVRTGRDRNMSISNSSSIPSCTSVSSWNGGYTGSNSIWDCQITGSGLCDNSTPPNNGGKCYFNVDSTGVLTNIGSNFVPTVNSPLPPSAEGITTTNSAFKRVVILSDEAANNLYKTQKTVTVIVTWTDFAGSHESKLMTILGKI